jgi:ribonuclease D
LSPINTPAEFVYVRDPAALAALVAQVDAAPRIALDTEADSLHSYFEKVCLIQLSLEGAHYLVDPLAGLVLEDLLRALSAKPLIVHGGDYDLRMLRSSLGFRPKGEIYDTVIAAQLLGFEQIGLAALIERFFQITLAKEGQKSDWSRRPLSQKQLNYAVDDTRFLEALAGRLDDELQARGRLEWHRESCRAMVESAGRDRSREPEGAWRIKGSGRMTPRQLVYLRELWHWRDGHARNADRPPFKVIGNQQIFDLIAWAEGHPGESPSRGFKLPRNIRGALLTTLEQALVRASATTPRDWPERRRGERILPLSGKALEQFNRLRAECSSVAAALGVAASTLAPKAALEAIVRQRPGNVDEIMEYSGLLRWQAELIDDPVARSLDEEV